MKRDMTGRYAKMGSSLKAGNGTVHCYQEQVRHHIIAPDTGCLVWSFCAVKGHGLDGVCSEMLFSLARPETVIACTNVV